MPKTATVLNHPYNPNLFDAFGVESPKVDTKTVLVSQYAPLGKGTNVERLEEFHFTLEPLKRYLLNISFRKPVWVWGPSGCGKTEWLRQVANRLNRNCHVISFGEETSIRELTGTFELTHQITMDEPVKETGIKGLIQSIGQLAKNGMGVKTRFAYGSLAKAIQDEYAIVVLDEYNMAPPGVAAQLNRLLECRQLVIPETGEVITMADNNLLVVTANTPGSMDESGIYAGSQVQNGATRTRFAGLRMSYLPQEEEEKLLRKAFPALDASVKLPDTTKLASTLMVELGNSVRSLVNESKVTLPFAVRQLKQWAQGTLYLKDMDIAFKDAYFDLLSDSERIAVDATYHKLIGKHLLDDAKTKKAAP